MLRDFAMNLLRAPFERTLRVLRGQRAETLQESFWALRDVSFEITKGKVVGVIGRNGSGKSTLLKILSRITDPSEGSADLYGRVGSLLEVGTGFHPEVTGRDNIFLYGAMLGMKRHEIKQRFDDIVAFSETEKFLDTPVKHYSSGMYTRLAFAVAAHLEPEILVVDEVLAVGDAAFQKKCLDKMEAVSRTGRTVLVVSHALPVIQSKCHSCIWLDKGLLVKAGPTEEVLGDYVKTLAVLQATPLGERTDRYGTGLVRFERIEFRDAVGNEVPALVAGEPAAVVLHFANTSGRELRNVYFHFHIDNSANYRVTSLMSQAAPIPPRTCCPRGCGRLFSICRAVRWPRVATVTRWVAPSTVPAPIWWKTPAPFTLRGAISTAPASRCPRVMASSFWIIRLPWTRCRADARRRE